MKVLITGVGGFIGAAVAKRFLEEGHDVYGVDDFSAGKPGNVPNGAKFSKFDLSDPSVMESIPKGMEVILHLAGQSSGEISFDNPASDLSKNTLSTLNLIKYAQENKVRKFVYASSMSVYGEVDDSPIPENTPCAPVSCYGVGKYASEMYLDIYKYEIPIVILRMFNVYGPGQDLSNLRQGMVSIFLAQAVVNGHIEVKGSLSRFRDFIYIDDVVEAWYQAALNTAVVGQTLNIGSGVKTTVRQLVDMICDLVPGTTYSVTDGTPGDQSGIYADISKMSGQIMSASRMTQLKQGLYSFNKWVDSNSLK